MKEDGRFLVIISTSFCPLQMQDQSKTPQPELQAEKKVLKLNALSRTACFHFCVPHQDSHFLALVSNSILKHLSDYKNR